MGKELLKVTCKLWLGLEDEEMRSPATVDANSARTTYMSGRAIGLDI